MSFLRKHDCQVAFQPFRRLGMNESEDLNDVTAVGAGNVVEYHDFTEARRRAVGEA